MEDDFNAHRRARAPGTADWVLRDEAFIQWNESCDTESRILLIHGPPGSGKSVLAASIINALMDTDCGDNICVYSFIRHDDANKRDLRATMRTLIFELTERIVVYNDVLRQSYERGEFASEELESIHHLWQSLFIRKLEKCNFVGSVKWVIDGLDESNASQRSTFLEYFADLRYLKRNLKILVVSRYNAEVVEKLKSAGSAIIEITEERTNADIRAVISRNIQCSELLTAAHIVNELTSSLEAKAHGLFLWIRLIFEELSQMTTETAIVNCLRTLPKGLSPLYERTFRAIENTLTVTHLQLSREIFRWTLSACRPLSLGELGSALEANFGRLASLPLEIKRCCGGLIIVESGRTVRLLHLTVAEYTNQRDSAFFVDPQGAHYAISKACLNSIPSYHTESQPLNFTKLNEDYPLMSYSSVYWPHHVHASNAIEEKDLTSAIVSMLTTPSVLTWISVNFVIGEHLSIIQAVDLLHKSVISGVKCSQDLHEAVQVWKEDIEDLAQEIVGVVEDYDGELQEGQRHGRGTCIYEIGDRYEGQWEEGKRHGFGVMTFINGNRHEGNWKANKQHGEGVWTFSDGVSYSGNWVEGVGQPGGVWTFPGGRSRIHLECSGVRWAPEFGICQLQGIMYNSHS